jgi:hypothetical protein
MVPVRKGEGQGERYRSISPLDCSSKADIVLEIGKAEHEGGGKRARADAKNKDEEKKACLA